MTLSEESHPLSAGHAVSESMFYSFFVHYAEYDATYLWFRQPVESSSHFFYILDYLIFGLTVHNPVRALLLRSRWGTELASYAISHVVPKCCSWDSEKRIGQG